MISDRNFSSEIGEYVVLKLELNNYRPNNRPIPDGFRLAGADEKTDIERDELRLLKLHFQNWQAPYEGRLAGWRAESPIYLLHNGQLVAGVYLVAGNEFSDEGPWGQLHYSFTDPKYRGQGLYRILFEVLIERAKEWGLEGIYINTDRYQLPEMYARWGAEYWRTIPKPRRDDIKGVWSSTRRYAGRAGRAIKRLIS